MPENEYTPKEEINLSRFESLQSLKIMDIDLDSSTHSSFSQRVKALFISQEAQSWK